MTMLYKYAQIDKNLIDSLVNKYLWFSKPSNFNDPFDCYQKLLMFKNPSRDYLEKIHKDQPQSTEEKNKSIQNLLRSNPHDLTRYMQEIVLRTINKSGVCCFSFTEKNILMWTHYARKHQGICIGFDESVDTDFFHGYPVKYLSDFEVVNYFDDFDKAFNYLILTKSWDWAYEQEFRIFKEEKIGPVHYNSKVLKEIIFGWKTSEEDIMLIIGIIKNNHYSSVVFKKAIPKENKFELSIIEIV